MPAYDPKTTIKKNLEHKLQKEEAKQEKALEKRLAKHQLAVEAKRQRDMEKASSKAKSRWEKRKAKLIAQHKKRTKVSKNKIRKAAWDRRVKTTKVAKTRSWWIAFADEVFMFIVKQEGCEKMWQNENWVRKFKAQCLECTKWSSAIHPWHHFSKGKYPAIRWDLRNCHHQCAGCNWNQWAWAPSVAYVDAVIKKIGGAGYMSLIEERDYPALTTVQIIVWIEENLHKVKPDSQREKWEKKLKNATLS